MAQWCGGHFDTRLFQAFVKAVGIYPVGSLVRLESDRLAVVIEQHPSSLLTPVVKVFYSGRTRMALPQRLIDLSRADAQDRIVSRELPEKWGFGNLDALWRE